MLDGTYERVLGESIEAEEEVSSKLHNAQISVPGIELTEATIQYRKSLLNVACTYEGRAGYSPEELLRSLGDPPSGGPAGTLVPDDEYGTATGAVPGGEIRLERCLVDSPNRRSDGYVNGRLDVSRLRFVSQRRGTSGPYIDSYVLSGFGIDFWPRAVRRTQIFPIEEHISRRQLHIVLDQDLELRIRKSRQGEYLVRLLPASCESSAWAHREIVKELLPALTFLCGCPVYIAEEELWSTEGVLLERISHSGSERSRLSPSPMPPVPFTSDFAVEVEDMFSCLLTKYREVKGTGLLIDQALHHLATAMSVPSEARFALLSVAFETLASSFARKEAGDQEASAKYLPKTEYHKVMRPLLRDIKKALSGKLPSEDLKALQGKLWGANNRAMGDRAKLLLISLGIAQDDRVARLLELRNSAIHEGSLSRERPPDLQEVVNFEEGMRTLLNKCVLRLLDYEGPFVDYGELGHPTTHLSKGS